MMRYVYAVFVLHILQASAIQPSENHHRPPFSPPTLLPFPLSTKPLPTSDTRAKTARFRQYSLTDLNPLGKARNSSLRSPHHPPLDTLLVFLPENEQTVKTTTHQNDYLSHHLRLNGFQ
ncbi:hypothetical protein FJTKL_13932 [Diaporthe vaccinii]|uniref:Uncharacterized protein n=1 Tax=Diaporthe vaccinii TaxID=105482 RepID=A0ABR4F9E2_9PEZI